MRIKFICWIAFFFKCYIAFINGTTTYNQKATQKFKIHFLVFLQDLATDSVIRFFVFLVFLKSNPSSISSGNLIANRPRFTANMILVAYPDFSCLGPTIITIAYPHSLRGIVTIGFGILVVFIARAALVLNYNTTLQSNSQQYYYFVFHSLSHSAMVQLGPPSPANRILSLWI